MPKASRTIEVDVPAEALMSVICDFERYPDFVGSVLTAAIEGREAERWRVAFEVVILRRRLRYRLDLRREGLRLHWDLVDGDHMLRNVGGWELRKVDEQTTRAVYALELELDTIVPLAMQGLLVDATLPRMLRDFKRRAEALAGSTWVHGV
jgi:ribosome-associated toxin RatA of RatAB toxin-antitoxin module